MPTYYSNKYNFYISPVKRTDLQLLTNHRNSYDIWSQLTCPFPITPASQEAWLKSLDDKTKQYFILYNKEDKIGFVRMDEIDFLNCSARVGVDIFKEYQGRKYSYNCWNLMLKYCFEELNINRVWLLVLETNTIAKRVYDKLGFKAEGSMREAIYRGGKFVNYDMMSLLRREWNDPTI